MAQMKTPGVYIREKNAFATTVVEAATAIPAFIGITEKAVNGTENLTGKPQKITSMAEFNQYFGGAPQPKFTLIVTEDTKPKTQEEPDKAEAAENAVGDLYKSEPVGGFSMTVKAPKTLYTLYYNMVMFFANGGGTCYIVSVGDYTAEGLDKDMVGNALAALRKVQDVTMIVVPEAVNAVGEYKNIMTDVIKHCSEMQNRFAIFDVQVGKENKNPIDEFREAIGTNYLSYGAAYYPYLNTSVLSDKDIDESIFDWTDTTSNENLLKFLNNGNALNTGDDKSGGEDSGKKGDEAKAKETEKKKDETKENEKIAVYAAECLEYNKIADLHNSLLQNWPAYKFALKKVKDYLNCLPPSAAMAGIYTMVDNTRGVWKAPANVSISYVNSLTDDIDDTQQDDLNMPMNGKAVNAIRVFPGEGVKVWGARTLDGNSKDWRYVNVRRTMLFLEESVKNASKPYVFEPNVSNTWLNMKSMIGSFLRSVWKEGGLAGATPEEAYEVYVGLGETMSEDDILDGIMRITVKVAITRPAEFIEITFQQQAQKS